MHAKAHTFFPKVQFRTISKFAKVQWIISNAKQNVLLNMFGSSHVMSVCHCLSLIWFKWAWLHLTPHKLHMTERPVVIRQNAVVLLETLLTEPWIPNELRPRVWRMDVNEAADADMAGQGYSHLTETQLSMDDTFMLKSVTGSIAASVLIKGKWQGVLTWNKTCHWIATWIVSNFRH